MRKEAFFWKNSPDVVYVSPRILDFSGRSLRIVSMVIEGEGGIMEVKEKEKHVLRERERFQIVAKIYEDNRSLSVLTIQKYNNVGGPSDYVHFSFVGEEIGRLLQVATTAKNMKLFGSGAFTLSENDIKALNLSDAEIEGVILNNKDLVAAIASKDITTQDIIALGFRKEQLKRFERLLWEGGFIEAEKERLGLADEPLWQNFFEKNQWIFGYGLSYVFVSGFDGKKLEQVVKGYDLGGFGKRADAVMKTQALINSLCFVEIKHSKTDLVVENKYRPGVWSPSKELIGAVSQCQVTVDSAMESFHGKYHQHDAEGDPTGEELHTYNPRSFLIVGNLDQLRSGKGVNRDKYRSFELFRRHMSRPEIITFDELYYRAKFIVEAAETA